MMLFLSLLRHDIRLQMRHGTEWAALVLFFVIVIVLLPFAVGPDEDLLTRLAPGFVWLAVVLMSFLALEKLFVQDGRDGTLDVMLLSSLPLSLIVFSKLLAQILTMLVALTVMVFPAALMLGMRWNVVPVLVLSLVLGVPVLVLLGGMVGAITVSLQRSPALLTLLLVPFYIPVLIFAVSACDAVSLGVSPEPHLLILAALLVLVVPIAPFVVAGTLRGGQG